MYKVKFYKGNYRTRQNDANADGATCYVEHHFNSCGSESPCYSVTIVGSNASEKSVAWGKDYTSRICEAFGTEPGGTGGVIRGGYGGRGNANLKYTAMPAILLEPLFASNPEQAGIIRSESGREKLASALVESIRTNFPDGGLVAFSVGHKYKKSSPKDRGAKLHGGGTEADYAEMVLERAGEMLMEK